MHSFYAFSWKSKASEFQFLEISCNFHENASKRLIQNMTLSQECVTKGIKSYVTNNLKVPTVKTKFTKLV